jgi:hypothetical protein
MPSEVREGTEYVGHLSKVELWPTVNNDPGRVEVIRITFEIYSLLPDRQELWRNWQSASFDVIVGSAIKPLTMAHKSLAWAVKVQNLVLADDWFRLDPQQGDGTANRKPGRWVQLTFKPRPRSRPTVFCRIPLRSTHQNTERPLTRNSLIRSGTRSGGRSKAAADFAKAKELGYKPDDE